MTFLPENYELPASENNFTKFEKDKTTKLRILLSWLDKNCVIYYEYFQDIEWWKVKPIRSTKKFTETPWINAKSQVKEVWSFKVYNYEAQSIQICSIPQKWIKETIMNLIWDSDYGDPLGYDIKISKTGEGMETKYSLLASPPKEFDDKLIFNKDKDIDWAWFLSSEKDIFHKIEE